MTLYAQSFCPTDKKKALFRFTDTFQLSSSQDANISESIAKYTCTTPACFPYRTTTSDSFTLDRTDSHEAPGGKTPQNDNRNSA
jgi:hypothetical protein